MRFLLRLVQTLQSQPSVPDLAPPCPRRLLAFALALALAPSSSSPSSGGWFSSVFTERKLNCVTCGPEWCAPEGCVPKGCVPEWCVPEWCVWRRFGIRSSEGG